MVLGRVLGEEMILNRLGERVAEEWLRSQDIRAEVQLDEFIVMPNHFHAIVLLQRAAGEYLEWKARGFQGSPARSISSPMQGFKSSSTRRINEARRTPGAAVWQRDYFERVLRSERELDRARAYILDNPRKWAEDKNNPANAA
jgi:REP element-mobilizing transposase RayT